MGPTANTLFKTTVTIPVGTPPGPAVLIATQDPTPGYVAVGWGVPARTLVTVTGPDGDGAPPAPPAVLDRPATLARATASAGSFMLVALSVAAAAVLAAGAAALAAKRSTARVAPAPGERR